MRRINDVKELIEEKEKELYALQDLQNVFSYLMSLIIDIQNFDYSSKEDLSQYHGFLAKTTTYISCNFDKFKNNTVGDITKTIIPIEYLSGCFVNLIEYIRLSFVIRQIKCFKNIEIDDVVVPITNLCHSLCYKPSFIKLVNVEELKSILSKSSLVLDETINSFHNKLYSSSEQVCLIDLKICSAYSFINGLKDVITQYDNNGIPSTFFKIFNEEILFYKEHNNLSCDDVSKIIRKKKLYSTYRDLVEDKLDFISLLKWAYHCDYGRIDNLADDLIIRNDNYYVILKLLDNPAAYIGDYNQDIEMRYTADPIKFLYSFYNKSDGKFIVHQGLQVERMLSYYSNINFEDMVSLILCKYPVYEVKKFINKIYIKIEPVISEFYENDNLRKQLIIVLAYEIYKFSITQEINYIELLKDVLLIYFGAKKIK